MIVVLEFSRGFRAGVHEGADEMPKLSPLGRRQRERELDHLLEEAPAKVAAAGASALSHVVEEIAIRNVDLRCDPSQAPSR